MTTPPDPPFVSVLVVTYNGRHFLDDCLRSLELQTYPRDRFEVVVVDNHSSDGSAAFLRLHFPWVRLVELGRNTGFAGGNNVGLRHARGELIALLNNDAVASPGWLGELVGAISKSADVGGVTSKILLRDEPHRLNSAGLQLYRDGRGGDRGFREVDRGQYDEPAEVFGGCGASLLLRRSMVEDVGFFDERLFLYYEDVDLAWRARLRGWRFLYEPRAVVRHVHGATSGVASPFFRFHVERNRVLVAWKNAPLALALWSLLGLFARAARAGLRAARGRSERDHAWALARAVASLVFHLPGVLFDRHRIRSLRRRVPDAALAPLIVAPPRTRTAA